MSYFVRDLPQVVRAEISARLIETCNGIAASPPYFARGIATYQFTMDDYSIMYNCIATAVISFRPHFSPLHRRASSESLSPPAQEMRALLWAAPHLGGTNADSSCLPR